jgi:adenosylhomocysteine nucleosidase
MSAVLGFVTGLTLEADVIEKSVAKLLRAGQTLRPHHTLCLGMGPENAQQAGQRLSARGAQILVSFGCAGALVPNLEAGTLLLPTQLVHPTNPTIPVDTEQHAAWARSLTNHNIPFITAPLAGAGDVVASSKDKINLASLTKAHGVDMESYALAHWARQQGLGFLAARVIIDPLGQNLPEPLLHAVGWDGTLNMPLYWQTLAKHPELRPEAARLRAQSRRCLARLRQATQALLSL